jgi:hypothetical protein
MNEAQHTTSCIVHLADSANLKGVTSNKLCSVLTGLYFESPNDTIHVTVTSNKYQSQQSRNISENLVVIFGNRTGILRRKKASIKAILIN